MTAAESGGYLSILDHAGELAETIRRSTPGSADQWAALRKIREAVDAARDAIVCSDPATEKPASEPTRNSVRLSWSGETKYDWTCPGCGNSNVGHVPPRSATPEQVTCEHCTATLKTI
jgi:hypothetical protein